MRSEETISIAEISTRLGKSKHFVMNAIEQGTLPGSCTKTPRGNRDFVVPRKAFEEYMTSWHYNPSIEFVQSLAELVTTKKVTAANSD